MPLERDKDNFGLEAFRQAINRQEGSFMRAATVIMNEPKNLSDNESVASALANHNALPDRNARGQFVKKDEDA